MPPIVRKAPLGERIKAYLDPVDWALWLLEELNSNEWEDFQKEWANTIGVVLNVVFMIARSNSGTPRPTSDDVFGDYDARNGSGWLTWFLTFVTHSLLIVSSANAVYTFYKRRHYRLFENSIDDAPNTPSARRVRVDSSPAASPLRFIKDILASTSAESRAHPDPSRDVWELTVWDPNPLCLGLFCLFSPGHVLLYCIFLPTAPLEPRPSVTVAKTIILAVILSVQLSFLRSFFTQQAKDNAIISRQVLNEYDVKYVHPSLNHPVRDVGTQTKHTSTAQSPPSNPARTREVDVYTPTTIINRGFRTNPNPSYASLYDPDNLMQTATTPALRTPSIPNYTTSAASTADLSSPIRPKTSHAPPPRPQYTGDGGSLGVFSHAASPLRKAASTNFLRGDDDGSRRREGSPLKRMSTPGGGGATAERGGSFRQRIRESNRY